MVLCSYRLTVYITSCLYIASLLTFPILLLLLIPTPFLSFPSPPLCHTYMHSTTSSLWSSTLFFFSSFLIHFLRALFLNFSPSHLIIIPYHWILLLMNGLLIMLRVSLSYLAPGSFLCLFTVFVSQVRMFHIHTRARTRTHAHRSPSTSTQEYDHVCDMSCVVG